MRKKTNSGFKKVLMIYGGVLLVLIATCVIVYIVYNNKIKESAKQSLLAAEKLTELVPNTGALEEASTEISKTINEVLEETASEINQNDEDENKINYPKINERFNNKNMDDVYGTDDLTIYYCIRL